MFSLLETSEGHEMCVQVQGMQFAALSLKADEENGGAYDLLFSNSPPGGELLSSSDCAAGTTLKLGSRPGKAVRSGVVQRSWKGTTWQASCTRALDRRSKI